ncbi:MAG TPA: PP2C family protein-serine/threonine phosphatase [Thermoanaerobaculia bacterium]|nr:PP2C family protein-serine/threonine phosphatase [Thermoanaerobaculia bacterium]
MKRFLPWVLAAAGLLVVFLALPLYQPAQPRGIQVNRAQAQEIADRAARTVGIKPEQSFPTLIWAVPGILDKELRNHPRRAEAWNDPVLGPRLNDYRVTYYDLVKSKFPALGGVHVGGQRGEVTEAVKLLAPEEKGASPTEAQLRPRADAFVGSRAFPGAPSPRFESARPTVLHARTDWIFRYRVPMTFPLENVVPYINVHFNGDKLAGWTLTEEYADGHQFSGELGGGVAGLLTTFALMFALLLVLLIIFLRKYHAGEVGVGAASVLFIGMIVLSIAADLLVRVAISENLSMGGLSASLTSWAQIAFKFLFADIPFAVIVFFAWAVGESFARERWGERLAAFDAILRRDAFNATVGRSVLQGVAMAPAIAGAALGLGAIAILTGLGWPSDSGGTSNILANGGPASALLGAIGDAICLAVMGLLFLLAWTHRRRVLWLGILATIALGTFMGIIPVPIDPFSMRLAFGIGGIAAAIAVFLRFDLLAATISMFGGGLIVSLAPLLSIARGSLAQDLTLTLASPLVVLAAFGAAALMTRREVVYTYDDLAPHVKRIVERERVKAEIDAANRIQAALLPQGSPDLAGASVASHYRAATEIGGDYFDFLRLPSGEVGIAFGDVAGHGLTSGIVMAMAKSALLVQVGNDPSPRVVLEVLNDIVMKTAPKRMMMTFFFGVLDSRSQTLRFSSAGHLDPYVYRKSSGALQALSSWGFPLGVRRREVFREHKVSFEPGDRIILYSDGLIEAIDDDGDPFGFERFEKTILASGSLSADEIKKNVLAAIRKFTRNRPPEDDQTLVVVAFDQAAAEFVTDDAALVAV